MYNDSGKVNKYVYYKKGKIVKSVYVGEKINNSLIYELNVIDEKFRNYNKILVDSCRKYAGDTEKYNFFKKEIEKGDSVTFFKIENIINKYGYPSFKEVGESCIIPFYILSFAPISTRDKYIDILTLAMYSGDIDPKSFAFFVDKLKVAKHEEQIYGTQFKDDTQKERIPSIDPENLNKRRVSVGLAPIND